jgi:hypothetical protein
MPDKLTAQPEPEYGAKQEQQATAQANPMPKGDTKVDIKAPSAAQPMQQQAPQGNPLMKLPPEVLYASLTERPKTPVQRQADVGMLWEVLATTSNEPMIRAIASSILGRENV